MLCAAALASIAVPLSGAMTPAMALPPAVITSTCAATWTPLTSGQLTAYNLTMSNNPPWGTCVITANLYSTAQTIGCPANAPSPGCLFSTTTCYPALGADIGNNGPPMYMPNNITTEMGCQGATMSQYCSFSNGCKLPATQVGTDN
jgi:hypothetical protein